MTTLTRPLGRGLGRPALPAESSRRKQNSSSRDRNLRCEPAAWARREKVSFRVVPDGRCLPVAIARSCRGPGPEPLRAPQRASSRMRGGVQPGGDRGTPHGKRGRPVCRGPARLRVTPSERWSGSAGFPGRPGAGGCRRGWPAIREWSRR